MPFMVHRTGLAFGFFGLAFLAASAGCGDDGGSADADSDGSGGSGGSTPLPPFGGAAGEGGSGEFEPECRGDEDCESDQECHATLGCVLVCRSSEQVVIETEDDLAALREQGCAVIEGSLHIQATELADLEALSPSPLRQVTDDVLIVGNELLESVAAFAGLQQIGGSLVVAQNANLRDLSGFESMAFLGLDPALDELVVTSNDSLVSLESLSELDLLSARVVVDSNPELTSLAGLGAVLEASSITVTNNASLSDWGGAFDTLESCSQSLNLANNPSLASVELTALFRCDAVTITANAALLGIELPELTVVDTALTIAGNAALESLVLDSLVSAGSLTIASNASLPQCQVDAIQERVGDCQSCSDNDETASCD